MIFDVVYMLDSEGLWQSEAKGVRVCQWAPSSYRRLRGKVSNVLVSRHLLLPSLTYTQRHSPILLNIQVAVYHFVVEA